jgi:hypothetical protein
VPEKADFSPGAMHEQMASEYPFLNILPGGSALPANSFTWTNGHLINAKPGIQTSSLYEIRQIEGSSYLFYEYKSDSYVSGFEKPLYVVMKKVDKDLTIEEIRKERPWIPDSSFLVKDANGFPTLHDAVDLPVVDDPDILGVWKTVANVENTNNFRPGDQQSANSFAFATFRFLPGGLMDSCSLSWTRGHVLTANPREPLDSSYEIRTIDGKPYLFLGLKNGDYLFGYVKPRLLVLEKTADARAVQKMPEGEQVDFYVGIDSSHSSAPRHYGFGKDSYSGKLIFMVPVGPGTDGSSITCYQCETDPPRSGSRDGDHLWNLFALVYANDFDKRIQVINNYTAQQPEWKQNIKDLIRYREGTRGLKVYGKELLPPGW